MNTNNNGVIPANAFIRINVIVGDKNRHGLIPMSVTSWYSGIKEGRYPAPIHLGGKTRGSYWRYSDILKLIDELAAPKPTVENKPIRKPKASLRLLDQEPVAKVSDYDDLYGDDRG